ncbi:hypothetical protein [Thermocatellispora tengchongensis]|uniref:hypothetical protein n=1 Tax=Thermocatellispora tengchongensis TaxID=1073253 RepID=UPI00362D3963
MIQDDLVEYEKAMERMAELVGQRQRDERPDTLWLLSHPSVYTIGRRTPPSTCPTPPTASPWCRRAGAGSSPTTVPGSSSAT